jgi:xanthine dehydrogenase YagS FAD-binding subunit
MQAFQYARASTVPDALSAAQIPGAMFIAGGTELLNWMKEGIIAPSRLIDINGITSLDRIEANDRGLRIGALARMSDVAEHEVVLRDYPVISEALLRSASAQIRNMASIGGNLMQRTRCPYFRAEVDLACNKRRPGSGCAALDGEDRFAAIFGWTESCVATHPSDLAVALAALDALVEIQGPDGVRSIPVTDLHRLPSDTPEVETNLAPGELIVAITVPTSTVARQSHYLKVRERTSYEFALVSAAAAIDLDGENIRSARVALGGVAPRPWRLALAESALVGVSIREVSGLDAALAPNFADAKPRQHNGFKIELAKRAAIRALQSAGEVA